MSNIGTYKTSSIGTADIRRNNTKELMFDNSTLRIGVVIKEYLPSDPENTSSGFRHQYDVLSYTNLSNGPAVPIVYKRAVVSTMFGGVADFSDYTLRAEPVTNNNQGNATSNGAVVLLLCANGDSSRTYIIGSSKNKLTEAESSTDGHYFVWEFNGANVSINNEGEISVIHKGPTNIEGDVTDILDNTSKLLFKADGSIEIVDAPGDKLLVEHGTLSAISTGDIQIQAGTSIDISATNAITETSVSKTTNAATVDINSPSVTINHGIDFLLKANPAFLAAFSANNGGATAAQAGLLSLLSVMSTDVSFVAAFPAVATSAITALAAVSAWLPLIAAYQATMVPGVAISITTKST